MRYLFFARQPAVKIVCVDTCYSDRFAEVLCTSHCAACVHQATLWTKSKCAPNDSLDEVEELAMLYNLSVMLEPTWGLDKSTSSTASAQQAAIEVSSYPVQRLACATNKVYEREPECLQLRPASRQRPLLQQRSSRVNRFLTSDW